MEKRTTALRTLLARNKLVIAPGAYDIFTAKLVEHLGFPAIYAGGNATGTHINVPEPFLGLTDQLDQARRIIEATTIPLITDAATAFGDGVHTYRTVREFERIGTAAIHIEDAVFPKRMDYHRTDKGGMGVSSLIPLDAMTDRLKIALDSRTDPDFLIIARTDAILAPGGIDEVLQRCHAFKETGADMILVAGQPSPEHGRRIRREVPGIPLMWISGVGVYDLPTSEIESMGYQLVIYSSTPQVLVADAFLKAYGHIRDHGTLGLDLQHIVSTRQKIHEIVGMTNYINFEAGH